ncbi:MAG: hypothetical protein ABI175_13305, partial [Polyangiales bacterium]
MLSRRVAPLLLTSLFALSTACGSSGDGGGDLDPSGDGGPLNDGTTGEGGETDPGFDVGTTCAPGSPCGSGGVCSTANTCCEPAASVCGAACCGSGQVCYAGSCVTPGKICRSVEDCAEGETCDPSLGADVDAGVVPACGDAAGTGAAGRCVPRPPVCPPGVDPSGGTCVAACEYHPPLGKFDAVTEWSWPTGAVAAPTYNQVMASAVVGPLTDDNCDTKFDERDIPAIVFNTYAGAGYGADGILRAVTGKGVTLWDATDAAARTVPGASIALGELDPTNPGPEIATCQSATGNLIVFSAKGKVLWTSADPAIKCVYGGPQLGDVNGDGTPELLVRYTVVDAKTHKSTFAGRASAYAYPT